MRTIGEQEKRERIFKVCKKAVYPIRYINKKVYCNMVYALMEYFLTPEDRKRSNKEIIKYMFTSNV